MKNSCNNKISFFKKLGSLLLCAMIIMTAGCGKSNTNNTNSVDNNNNINGTANTNTEAKDTGEKAMGRYVETFNKYSEEAEYPRGGITLMQDGSLAIFDLENGKYRSKDQGLTWEKEETSWLAEFKNNAYLHDGILSNDGYIAVQFTKNGEDNNEELIWHFSLFNPDGTEIPIGEEIKDITCMSFSNQGELYILSRDNTLYKINKDTGKAENLFSIVNTSCYFSVYDTTMVAMNYQGIYIYDLEKKEIVEDKVLSDFFTETVKSFDFNSRNYYSAIILQDKDQVVYIACRQGLYRHVIGGSAMEQVMDGNLNTFSNPSVSFLGIVSMEDNIFITLFSGAGVAKYSYDPDMPTVPDQQLTAYSLVQNDSLQQAVTIFQQKHPDIYIKYEIGMSEDTSLTREDAIKNLNTKILAGEGPDVFMLDNMPIDSYLKKGILADLTPYLNELEKTDQLLPNIKNTYQDDEKICAIPSKFRVPAILGDKEVIKNINSIKDLADAVEMIREENPKGMIMGYYMPIEALIKLSTACAADWQNADGSINEKGLTEFLTQAKRIYEADIAGVSQADIEKHVEIYSEIINSADYFGEKYDRSSSVSLGGYQITINKGFMDVGYLDGNQMGMAMISSSMKKAVNKNLDFSGLSWGSGNTYLPVYIMGISAASKNQELAGEFLNIMLGKENQDLTNLGGYSVNQQAFENHFTYYNIDKSASDEERIIGGMSGDEGERLDIYWPPEIWLDKCKSILSASDTPNLTDPVLKDTVFEMGISALNGEKTVEQTVKDIVARLAIYMSE